MRSGADCSPLAAAGRGPPERVLRQSDVRGVVIRIEFDRKKAELLRRI